MSPCCKVPCYQNPMYYDETNCRFGHYSTCSKCNKLHGEAKLIYTAPIGLRKAWTSLSEVMVREHHAKGEGRPLRFTMEKAGLTPLGYKPAQVEIAEVEGSF